MKVRYVISILMYCIFFSLIVFQDYIVRFVGWELFFIVLVSLSMVIVFFRSKEGFFRKD